MRRVPFEDVEAVAETDPAEAAEERINQLLVLLAELLLKNEVLRLRLREYTDEA